MLAQKKLGKESISCSDMLYLNLCLKLQIHTGEYAFTMLFHKAYRQMDAFAK